MKQIKVKFVYHGLLEMHAINEFAHTIAKEMGIKVLETSNTNCCIFFVLAHNAIAIPRFVKKFMDAVYELINMDITLK